MLHTTNTTNNRSSNRRLTNSIKTRSKLIVANPAADLLELDGGALVPSNFVTAVDADAVTVDTPDGLFDLDA